MIIPLLAADGPHRLADLPNRLSSAVLTRIRHQPKLADPCDNYLPSLQSIFHVAYKMHDKCQPLLRGEEINMILKIHKAHTCMYVSITLKFNQEICGAQICKGVTTTSQVVIKLISPCLNCRTTGKWHLQHELEHSGLTFEC